MTRISSLFVATTLAILPLSAFAQQGVSPVKVAAPTTTTSAATTPVTAPVASKTVIAPVKPVAPTTTTSAATTPVTAPVTNTTAATGVTQPAKSDIKDPAQGAKTEVHGMKTVHSHHAKLHVPAKIAEPAKS